MPIGNLSDVPANQVLYAGNPIIIWYQAGVGTIKPSHLVEEDDADEVKICGTGGTAFAIAMDILELDLDTVFTSGIAIPVAPLNQKGCIYWLGKDGGTEAIAKGTKMLRSDRDAGHIGIGAGDIMSIDTEATARFKYGRFVA